MLLRILSNSLNSKESSQAPRIPQKRPEPGVNFLDLQNRFQIDPKIDPNFDVILVSFLVLLGLPLAPLLGSLLATFGAQVGPSSLLDGFFGRKR